MKVTGTIHGPNGFSAALELTPLGGRAVASGALHCPAMREALQRRFPGHAVEVQSMNRGGEWVTVGVAVKARIGGAP